jgi:hypothetical protein
VTGLQEDGSMKRSTDRILTIHTGSLCTLTNTVFGCRTIHRQLSSRRRRDPPDIGGTEWGN